MFILLVHLQNKEKFFKLKNKIKRKTPINNQNVLFYV